jgi:hypothetical protein
MINDPSVLAIIQARRQYNARDPNSIITAPKGNAGQTDPPEPGGGNLAPVQPPPASPADRAAARQTMMNNYMQRMGLQGYRYGAGNVRTGNIPRGGSNGAGYQALVPGALPVNGAPPVSGSTLTPVTLPSTGAGVAEPIVPQDPRNGTGGGGGFGAI